MIIEKLIGIPQCLVFLNIIDRSYRFLPLLKIIIVNGGNEEKFGKCIIQPECFVAVINKSQIFEWKNVRRLRWLGSLLIISFLFYLIPQVVNYWGLKEVFALDKYIIAPLALQVTDLLLGLGCLIVAETFAIGLKMKEEQELTI